MKWGGSILNVQSALYEHRFWLQISGDHARFICNTLSPIEDQDVQVAASHIEAFNQLLEGARNISLDLEIGSLTTEHSEIVNTTFAQSAID